MFESKVLRKIFGPKGGRGNRGQEETAVLSLMICSPLQNLSDQVKKNEMGGVCGERRCA